MTTTALTQEQRAESLHAMSTETFDVLVIGGGVTGAGIALDAASRGLSTAVIEGQDWASGTSSRSSRLVHGGLRYLYNLDFKLVAEALKERGRLLTVIAPHLVEAQPFLWPLKTPVIERAYSAVGVGMYDALAVIGAGKKTVPIQKHHSKKGALKRFPEVKPDALCGAIEFYDARVDDARLVITLIRTALKYGAQAASRVKVTAILKDSKGHASGVEAEDLETGEKLTIKAKRIINATGVWTEETQDMAGGTGGLKVLASKGIHIVIPRERLKAKTGLFLRTEKSVLFIIPWQHYWVIGTTDTAWHEQLKHPVPTSADIDYVLAHANEHLLSMTDGRFELRRRDQSDKLRDGALELNVMDYHSGRERGASSLSGGEAFLASLSLALGLSETIAEEAGGVTIDTLFVDEGFGSLDPAALDQAIGTLLRLGEGARLVGVVSHVEELRRRVPRQIVVDAAPDKGSRARVVCD